MQLISTNNIKLSINKPSSPKKVQVFLQRSRYTTITVFVYHYSGISYMLIQRDKTIMELLESIVTFENFARTHRVQVRNYHADNGRFASNAFINHVKS